MVVLRSPLSNRIDMIKNDPLYAGHADLSPRVGFFKGGNDGDRLILKDSSASDETPPGAVLRIIGQISRSKHYLRPKGTYNGGDVKNARLRFNLLPPKGRGLDKLLSPVEFDTFIENLKTIHNDNAEGVEQPGKEIHLPFDVKEGVTVFHQLIIPREDESDDGDDIKDEDGNVQLCSIANSRDPATVVSTESASGPFSLEGWPVESDGDWRKKMNSSKDTHVIYPMQAFTYEGKLIHPLEYMKKLPDAVVDLSFSLVHYDFDKSSRVCLYMTELHVIVPPEPLPGYPRSTKRGLVRK
ncbi:hypothetical protein SCHPADRAFT_253098 [Schizopora paradoxa]|uniref:Uncharacterized protein n=1 Tax=Schizopora paradoxa TaxID=27342 RepID=A0A0H2RVQ5_9AGAM|nr:hypothetical protein SCHPADRAFT_253098 [Schizopora paradoxa]